MGLLSVFNRVLVCIHKSRGSLPDTAAVPSTLPSMSEGAEMDVGAFAPDFGMYKEKPSLSLLYFSYNWMYFYS